MIPNFFLNHFEKPQWLHGDEIHIWGWILEARGQLEVIKQSLLQLHHDLEGTGSFSLSFDSATANAAFVR